MGKVSIGFSMALDGFIAGPNDSPDLPLGEGGDVLFRWYSSGDTSHKMSSGENEYKVSGDSARMLEDASQAIGALVYGRRTFDIAHAWGGKHPMDVPMVIVTHRIPQEWLKEGSPFTFVTNGIESAIEQAKIIAGGKNVAVGSGTVTQQCLNAGLIDEIHIDLIPVLLGAGVRLFDHLSTAPIDLESPSVIEAAGVTHLTYQVLK
jgi:dihydrofolate reductase